MSTIADSHLSNKDLAPTGPAVIDELG